MPNRLYQSTDGEGTMSLVLGRALMPSCAIDLRFPEPPTVPSDTAPLFRGGLVFKAHRLVYHSTPGSRVIKKRRRHRAPVIEREKERVLY